MLSTLGPNTFNTGQSPGSYHQVYDWRLIVQYYAGNGPIPNTLELSLKSGLDRLFTLRRLEVLDFAGVDHRMNEAELEWMVNNLPSLRVVGGLKEFTVFRGMRIRG